MRQEQQSRMRRRRRDEPSDRTQAEHESRQRYQFALDWAKRNLPDEHAPFAASAYLTLDLNRGKPSADEVRRRLTDQGRDRKALGL